MAQLSSQIPTSSTHNNISDTEINPDGKNPYDQQNTPLGSRSPTNNPQNGSQSTNVRSIITDNNNDSANNNDSDDIDDKTFFIKMRGSLMIVAILAAGSTYQAGINPPGSVWQDNNGHKAGAPILHDTHFDRYLVFFYCNAVSFLSSLVIIIFLMNKRFYCKQRNINILQITMVLDLFTFTAAYSVGSSRLVSTSVYIFLIMGGVFIYIISFARFASQMSCNTCIGQRRRSNEAHQTRSAQTVQMRPIEAAPTDDNV